MAHPPPCARRARQARRRAERAARLEQARRTSGATSRSGGAAAPSPDPGGGLRRARGTLSPTSASRPSASTCPRRVLRVPPGPPCSREPRRRRLVVYVHGTRPRASGRAARRRGAARRGRVAPPVTPQRRTALVSVGAAVALMAIKLGTGLASSSLGLVSEALHSGTDLVAALLTFFAIGVAVRPRRQLAPVRPRQGRAPRRAGRGGVPRARQPRRRRRSRSPGSSAGSRSRRRPPGGCSPPCAS